MQPETKAIRIQSERSLYSEHSVPLYLTSGFVFENSEEMRASFTEEIDRNVYSRYSNPNCSEFVSKMIALKGLKMDFLLPPECLLYFQLLRHY